MPHFVVHCSENVLVLKSPEEILKTIHDTADATGLFEKGDIKVRIQAFGYFTVGGTKSDFIHIFGSIMEGRTTEQKATLSREIIRVLKAMFPEVPVLSINIWEFEKATYCNRDMI
jgi:5-carboxymethyl-2-hydroxymuconate isomerase